MIKGELYGIDGRQEGGRAASALRRLEEREDSLVEGRVRLLVADCTSPDGLIIACPENGDVVLFDPSPDSYKELARASILDAPVRAMPALSGGKLFVAMARS